ncbi:transporter substrate-binding domain-containing protein [Catenovulum agarivorans]|nr:transporter substrate-binding domain-containing protein [Catenovulum agarivorans]
MKNLMISLACCIGISLPVSAAQVTLNVNNSESINNIYQLQLLKEALSRDPNNQYIINTSPVDLNEGQMVNYIQSGEMDVMWGGTNNKYEQLMEPIRVPLFKGLLGHRLFIIRKGEQQRFNGIDSLSALRQFKVGQGRQWADTQVLESAGLDVVTAMKYDGLFYMLEGGRFDAFPRGVHEPFAEVSKHSELNLTVEKNLLLVYPLAAYFFVAKDNAKLAQTIETGLMEMIDDGSFDKFFYQNPMVAQALENAQLANRTVFRIDNPNMPPLTPYDNEKLWFKIE